jgi:pSer/pThr/pTyr-binding forkhead associated (FHA) protein
MEEVLIDIKPIIENNSNIAYILPSWANKSNKINNPYSIDIWKEGITIKSFSLSVKSFFIIGRNKSLCDITLTNPTISRTHCVLQYQNNESLFLYDLNSVYGTFINGEKINPLKYYKLKSGDIFKLRNSKKMFILNRESDDIKNEEDDNFKFHVNDEIRKLLNEKKKR